MAKENTFACLIAGSRTFDDYNLLKDKMDNFLQNKDNILIISGGARGADSLAERYAKEKNYSLKVMPAEWDKHGKKAGYIRNTAMHDVLKEYSDRGCVLFWDGKSKGTQHNIPLAEARNTPVRIVRF